MKDYLKNLLYKLIFRSRSGHLTITDYAERRRVKYVLTYIDIDDAWRWGNIEEVRYDKYVKNQKTQKIVRRFEAYNVVLIVQQEGEINTLTDCWRYAKIKWQTPIVYKK